MINKFNIRVYGVISLGNKYLIVNERINNKISLNKFIGGGLEYGESTIECLKRECFEELGLKIDHIKHFYTQDIFMTSHFNKNEQLLIIYYTAKALNTPSNQYFDKKLINFYWKTLKCINKKDFMMPLDKKVIELLKENRS